MRTALESVSFCFHNASRHQTYSLYKEEFWVELIKLTFLIVQSFNHVYLVLLMSYVNNAHL